MMKFEGIDITEREIDFLIFPFELKDPDGNVVLKVDRSQTVFVNGTETSDAERIGDAFKTWASRWDIFQKNK